MTLHMLIRRPVRRQPASARPGLAFLMAIGLAACGGGGGYAEPVAPPAAIDALPVTAAQSAEGLASYLTALAQVSVEVADAHEPLALGDFAPTLVDDAEPVAVLVPGA
jgi:hypothetical protein